jgi:catalase
VIEVTTRIDDPEQSGGLVVFDPTRVVDSITLSDDPILRYRGASYGESIARRTS